MVSANYERSWKLVSANLGCDKLKMGSRNHGEGLSMLNARSFGDAVNGSAAGRKLGTLKSTIY
jgi:hypothetical protein